MSKSDSSKEPDEDISEIVFDERVFGFSQEIQIVAYETSDMVHERLRSVFLNSIVDVKTPTKITTPSGYCVWYPELWEGVIVINTSTCKHEFPAQIFVWRVYKSRDFVPNKSFLWEEYPKSENHGTYTYYLLPLERELTREEKDMIYDKM